MVAGSNVNDVTTEMEEIDDWLAFHGHFCGQMGRAAPETNGVCVCLCVRALTVEPRKKSDEQTFMC